MKYFILTFFALLLSCSKKQEPIHKDLVYFNAIFLAELGDAKYDKLYDKTTKKIKPKYIDDIIYVTNYVEANACGQYSGNLLFKKDSIILIYKQIAEEVCASTAIEKVTYIIKNPKEKRYKFALRFE
jgi:hypothetical protein